MILNQKEKLFLDAKINNNNFQKCSKYDCNLICENCENENCLWTIRYQIDKDLLAPDNVFVKGFSGDKLIKLFMKPQSPSQRKKYYIIVSSPKKQVDDINIQL